MKQMKDSNTLRKRKYSSIWKNMFPMNVIHTSARMNMYIKQTFGLYFHSVTKTSRKTNYWGPLPISKGSASSRVGDNARGFRVFAGHSYIRLTPFLPDPGAATRKGGGLGGFRELHRSMFSPCLGLHSEPPPHDELRNTYHARFDPSPERPVEVGPRLTCGGKLSATCEPQIQAKPLRNGILPDPKATEASKAKW